LVETAVGNGSVDLISNVQYIWLVRFPLTQS